MTVRIGKICIKLQEASAKHESKAELCLNYYCVPKIQKPLSRGFNK